jgi:hypothetical protein
LPNLPKTATEGLARPADVPNTNTAVNQRPPALIGEEDSAFAGVQADVFGRIDRQLEE